MYCFGCLPKTEKTILVRRRTNCLPRGTHRPRGGVVPHSHVRQAPLYACADCGTLVARVQSEVVEVLVAAMRKWQREHPEQELEVVLFGDQE